MERNVLVDRLKGYACFLVLFGHVIMGIRLAGIDIPGFFVGIEKFIWSFHVALFLFLGGVVYKVTGEWKSKKSKWGFLLYKLYNLGIPYIAFSVIYIDKQLGWRGKYRFCTLRYSECMENSCCPILVSLCIILFVLHLDSFFRSIKELANYAYCCFNRLFSSAFWYSPRKPGCSVLLGTCFWNWHICRFQKPY